MGVSYYILWLHSEHDKKTELSFPSTCMIQKRNRYDVLRPPLVFLMLFLISANFAENTSLFSACYPQEIFKEPTHNEKAFRYSSQ